MRKEHVEALKKVMQTATNLNMEEFQERRDRGYCRSIEDLHSCGNTACVAGYMALMPEFVADGGGMDDRGSPEYIDSSESEDFALARFLGISEDLADSIVFGDDELVFNVRKDFKDWTPKEIISILDQILSGKLE